MPYFEPRAAKSSQFFWEDIRRMLPITDHRSRWKWIGAPRTKQLCGKEKSCAEEKTATKDVAWVIDGEGMLEDGEQWLGLATVSTI